MAARAKTNPRGSVSARCIPNGLKAGDQTCSDCEMVIGHFEATISRQAHPRLLAARGWALQVVSCRGLFFEDGFMYEP